MLIAALETHPRKRVFLTYTSPPQYVQHKSCGFYGPMLCMLAWQWLPPPSLCVYTLLCYGWNVKQIFWMVQSLFLTLFVLVFWPRVNNPAMYIYVSNSLFYVHNNNRTTAQMIWHAELYFETKHWHVLHSIPSPLWSSTFRMNACDDTPLAVLAWAAITRSQVEYVPHGVSRRLRRR